MNKYPTNRYIPSHKWKLRNLYREKMERHKSNETQRQRRIDLMRPILTKKITRIQNYSNNIQHMKESIPQIINQIDHDYENGIIDMNLIDYYQSKHEYNIPRYSHDFSDYIDQLKYFRTVTTITHLHLSTNTNGMTIMLGTETDQC